MWKGESQENKIHGGPGLERQIGGWHLGTHDLVATTASHLHGKNVFNITRKRLRCNFVWAHLHLIHYFQKNMWKGESGREWNPWGLRVGKPNWGVTPRDPRLYCYPCLLSAWCFSLGHFERLRFNFVWGRLHLNPKKIKSSGAGRLGGSGWWVV